MTNQSLTLNFYSIQFFLSFRFYQSLQQGAMQKLCIEYEIYIDSFLWRPLSCIHEKHLCKINLIHVLTDFWSQKHSQVWKIENFLEKYQVPKSLFHFLQFHTRAKFQGS